MSAAMIRQNKHVRLSVEDDSEVSTTAGCSDHSDDEPPSSPACSMVDLTQQELMAELVSNFHAVYAFLSLLLLTACRMQKPMQAIASPSQPTAHPASPLPAARKAGGSKATKGSARQVKAPPGLSFPPGIFQPCQASESQRSLFQKVGPPPGLESFAPPGLEGFAPLSFPPGLGPHSQPSRKQPKQARTSKRVENVGRKQPLVVPVVPQAPICQPPLPAAPLAALEPREFDQVIYRKELSDVMRDLANGINVAACVRRIRAQSVPEARQAEEFSDILTRAAEENRGSARRLAFAFAVGLAAGESNSAFAHEECEKGLELFFGDVFEELAAEVPRLRSKVANELVPTLRTAFTMEQLARLVPPDCRTVAC